MKRVIILLTAALMLLLTAGLAAVQTPASLMRLSDLANQHAKISAPSMNPDNTAFEPIVMKNLESNQDFDSYGKKSSEIAKQMADNPNSDDAGGNPSPIPEPTSLILIGLGLAGAGIIRKKK